MKLSGKVFAYGILIVAGLIVADRIQCGRKGPAPAKPEGTGPANKEATAGEPAGDENAPIRDIRLPMAYYPDGAVKWQIKAGSAVVPPGGGDINASNVTVEMFAPDGKPDGRLVAAQCFCSRTNGMVTSQSDVVMVKPGIRISGTGVEWDSKEQIVRILSNVTVVLSGKMRNTGKGGKE